MTSTCGQCGEINNTTKFMGNSLMEVKCRKCTAFSHYTFESGKGWHLINSYKNDNLKMKESLQEYQKDVKSAPARKEDTMTLEFYPDESVEIKGTINLINSETLEQYLNSLFQYYKRRVDSDVMGAIELIAIRFNLKIVETER